MYEDHPVLFILTFGIVAAKVTNKLVVSITRLCVIFASKFSTVC